MSKASKKTQREKRLAAKRARRAANKAKYESWKREGINRKSKRAFSQSKRQKRAKTISHRTGACGNIACRRCDPAGIFRRNLAA